MKSFSFSKSHSVLKNTACVNGSVAVLLYGLLQNLLPLLRQISHCMIVPAAVLNNEPRKESHSL